MNKVYRFDIHGKSILKTLNKFYTSDLGIKQIRTNSEDINYSVALESIVYNELIDKDYKVYIGKSKKVEIDFIATKNNKTRYIQVCYKLDSKETIESEFGAFDELQTDTLKYVISLDNKNYSRNNIIHINIFKFLMTDDIFEEL